MTAEEKVKAGLAYAWGKDGDGFDIVVEQVRENFWIAYILTEAWATTGKTPDEAANEFKLMSNILIKELYDK